MKRQTSRKLIRGDAALMRKQGYTVYRWFKDVPSTLATANTLKKQGLLVTDETPVVDYVLSGHANRAYCLFSVEDATLKKNPPTEV